MTAQEFESWVEKASRVNNIRYEGGLAQGTSEKVRPAGFDLPLLGRLRVGKEVTDKATLQVVDTWKRYESSMAHRALSSADDGLRAGTQPAKYAFPETKRVIDAVLPFTKARPALQVRLHDTKAGILRQEKDLHGANREYRKALEVLKVLLPLPINKALEPLTPESFGLDVQRIHIRLHLAHMLNYEMGDKKSAEMLYTEILSYPFHVYQGNKDGIYQYAMGLYSQAGMGLIDVRRGNLEALRSTNIFDNTELKELRVALGQAIGQAQVQEQYRD